MSYREAPAETWAVSVAYMSGSSGAHASWGERRFFEREDLMRDFVLDAMLDIDAENDKSTTRSSSRRWLRRRREVDELDYKRKRVTSIMGVWQLVAGEWKAIDVTLASPGVVLGYGPQPETDAK